jgi:hypothetical protein
MNNDGFCQCGCGGKTQLAVKNDASRGQLKGQPKHFIRGHAIRGAAYKNIYKKIDKSTGCWAWQGNKIPGDYGVLKIDGKRILAHRLSWQLQNGLIPPGMFVCHKCDNPSCINPDHLFIGTQKDNMEDCKSKGRNSPPPQNNARGPSGKFISLDMGR